MAGGTHGPGGPYRGLEGMEMGQVDVLQRHIHSGCLSEVAVARLTCVIPGNPHDNPVRWVPRGNRATDEGLAWGHRELESSLSGSGDSTGSGHAAPTIHRGATQSDACGWSPPLSWAHWSPKDECGHGSGEW